MREKGKAGPSLRKILLLVSALVLFIVLLGLLLLAYSARSTARQTEERLDSAIREQLELVDKRLMSVNLYLTDTLLRSEQVKAIDSAQDVSRRNNAARALANTFTYQSKYWTEEFSLFYYHKPSGLSFWCTSPISSPTDGIELAERLKSAAASGQVRENKLSWNFFLVDGRPYLAQMYAEKDHFAASWVCCDNLFSVVPNAVLSEKGFYALLDEQGSPLTAKDRLEEAGVTFSGGAAEAPGRALCRQYSLSRAGLQLLAVDFPNSLPGDFLLLAGFLMGVLLILFAFSAYTLYYYRHYIEAPFHRFQEHLTEFETVNAAAKRKGFFELNQTLGAFDSLQGQFRKLKIDFYEEKLALAKTELEYYQVQIKPHFFLNCFSIIFSMSQSGDFEKIQLFTMKLSNYVRYLFHDGFHMVALGTELSMIREYMDIQSIRRNMSMRAEDEVSAALYGREIPPLMLMTLVENAIKHSGVTDGSLAVSIRAEETADSLILTVRDNGKGFSPGALENLNQPGGSRTRIVDGSRHVGLHNVCKRLSLLYGERASITFRNVGQGAEVRITIPSQALEPGKEMEELT